MDKEEQTNEIKLELFYQRIIKDFHDPEVQKDYQEWCKRQEADKVAVAE